MTRQQFYRSKEWEAFRQIIISNRTGAPTWTNFPTIPTVPSTGSSASAVGTSASGGSATTWSRSDHVHNITKATITSAMGYTIGDHSYHSASKSLTGTTTSNSTWTEVDTWDVPANSTWIAHIYARFAYNSTGVRSLCLSETSGAAYSESSSDNVRNNCVFTANSGKYTYIHIPTIITNDTNEVKTFYINCYHTAGTNTSLTTTAGHDAVRIS